MYETVIPTNEREQLGEYYTPSWLAKAMIQELVTDPLNQRVLDPASGSGTFIAEAVNHFIAAAAQTDWSQRKSLQTSGSCHRHRRSLGRSALGPGRLGLSRSACDQCCRQSRHAIINIHSHACGRKATFPVHHRPIGPEEQKQQALDPEAPNPKATQEGGAKGTNSQNAQATGRAHSSTGGSQKGESARVQEEQEQYAGAQGATTALYPG